MVVRLYALFTSQVTQVNNVAFYDPIILRSQLISHTLSQVSYAIDRDCYMLLCMKHTYSQPNKRIVVKCRISCGSIIIVHNPSTTRWQIVIQQKKKKKGDKLSFFFFPPTSTSPNKKISIIWNPHNFDMRTFIIDLEPSLWNECNNKCIQSVDLIYYEHIIKRKYLK